MMIMNTSFISTEIQSIYDTFGQERTLKEVEELKNEGYEFENEAAAYRMAGFVMTTEDAFPGLNRDEITEIAFIESENGELYSVDLPITDWSVVKDSLRKNED